LWPLKLDDRLGDVCGTSKNRVGSGAVVGVVVDQRWQKACGILILVKISPKSPKPRNLSEQY